MLNWGLSSLGSRLALKIAAPAAVATGLGAAYVLPEQPWGALVAGAIVGLVTYGAAHYWLHGRLQAARASLRHIRQHNFDELTPPSRALNDELSTVLWEVYRTGQTLDSEIQDLKERESYRREFIGNVSHELKTPIFSVQGFTETLLDGALDDDEVNRTFLKKIQRNVKRLETLVRDLSAITEIETGELEMSSEPFAVADLFQDVRDSVGLKAENKNISLRTELEEGLSPMYGDRDRIRRVLVNLADNAIKYNEPGGTVLLRAHARTGDEIEVNVIDDGPGIPEEHLPRLTERFYRVDRSRARNQGGTGLGLAIVKHILGAHDRDLHVESTLGEGSSFGFTLPTTPPSS